ncbi:MAG TPA: Uma2 family endonuclease [Phycisphaerae bacterium]|nr:Uma2 family endonuclease [Phycisphaerae bacterium]
MTIAAKLLTADDLWNMPGNGDGYELVLGELRPMPPSGQQHSSIGVTIITALQLFVKVHKLGKVTGPDGGYILHRNADTVRAPDVGFVTADRLPNGRTAQKWFPGHPDLAVEIISPTDVYGDVDEKVQEFLDAGTRLVWVVNPRHKTVTVFRNDNSITALGPTDQLSGESVLPGFTLTVSEIFE